MAMLTHDEAVRPQQRTSQTVRVLAVVPPGTGLVLTHLFAHTNWELTIAETLGRAREILGRMPVHVVLCTDKQPDGHWKELLGNAHAVAGQPSLMVLARGADDRLWGEALDMGAYDVLVEPFRADELYVAVSAAWRHWSDSTRANAQRPGCEKALTATVNP
jgi:DNA-binding response OmpR family regulator